MISALAKREQKLMTQKRQLSLQSCVSRSRAHGAITNGGHTVNLKISDDALKWPMGLRDKVDDMQRGIQMLQFDQSQMSSSTKQGHTIGDNQRRNKNRVIPQKY